MFEELLKTESWKKKLEAGGFKVVLEPYLKDDADRTGKYKKVQECQQCGTMTVDVNNGLCPHCTGG